MLKIVCRALGHRLRIVQEFTPVTRRVKCVRCDGDWGMNDDVRVMIDWCPALEQLHREHGCEILEPLPAWRSFPVEPLTLGEVFRAARWPGVIAMALAYIAGYTVAGFGIAVQFVAQWAVSYTTMRLQMPRVYDRAYERKCNSLEA